LVQLLDFVCWRRLFFWWGCSQRLGINPVAAFSSHSFIKVQNFPLPSSASYEKRTRGNCV